MSKKLAGNTFFHVLILLAVAIYTFLPTLEMFFYLDEWGNLYEWTHFPYKFTLFTSHIFYLLFRLFGTYATGYFAVGLAIYALSVVVFYLFVSRLLKSKILGLIAGLLYATAPIGSSTVVMIWTYVAEGGYPLTIMLLLLLYLLLAYFQERKGFYFLLALFVFLLFLELEPRRAFLFLPVLILFDYLVNFKKPIPSLGFAVRLISLFLGFVAYYKYDVFLSKIFSTGKIIFSDFGSTYDWQTRFALGRDSLTHAEPLITLTNILLAGPWLFVSERLVGYVDLADIGQIQLLVIVTLALIAALVVLAWKTKQEWGRLILFSLGWIYTNILGIYIFSSPGVSDATHRTLSLAAPGYALFITLSGVALYTSLKKKKGKLQKKLNGIFVLILLIFLVVNFSATRYNFNKFNTLRSKPARAFFNDLKRFYPTLPANSLIYIEASPNPQIKYRLSRIYGGNNYGAGSTIAVFYPERTKEEIDVVRDYQAVEKFVGKDPSKIDRVFAFYYDENGLSNITANIRSRLGK